MSKSVLIVVIGLMAIGDANAQEIIWSRTYGGPANETARSILLANDGGFIMVGSTESFAEGVSDMYILRIAPGGDTVWTGQYDGGLIDQAFSVIQGPQESFMIAGNTFNHTSPYSKIFLIRMHISGNPIWARFYGPQGYDWRAGVNSFSIIDSPNGNYLLAGNKYRTGPVYADLFMVEVNADGDTLWNRTYSGSIFGAGLWNSYKADGDDIIHAGFNGRRAYILKTLANGDSIWAYEFQDGDRSLASSIKLTSDNNYIVAGTVRLLDEDNTDVFLAKIDNSGTPIWFRTYGGSEADSGFCAVQTPDRGYLIAGSTCSYGAGGDDIYLLKIDQSGDLVWSTTYGGINNDGSYAIIPAEDSNYMIAGYAGLSDSTFSECWLLKITCEPDYVPDNQDNIVPARYRLIGNYPNPFNSSTAIRYDLSEPAQVRLEIYNILGQRISTLFNSYQISGKHSILWKADNCPSGIYSYKLTADNRTETGRMLLLR